VSVSGPPKLDFRGWMTVLYWPVSRCAKVQRPKNHQVRGEAGMGRGLRNQVEQVAEEGGSPSKSACGPGTRKARLFVNAVWAACVGRADHQAMYA